MKMRKVFALFIFLLYSRSFSGENHNLPQAVSFADSIVNLILIKNDTILKSYNMRPYWINKNNTFEEYSKQINNIKKKINSNEKMEATYYEKRIKSGVINIYYKIENNKEEYLCVALNRQDGSYQFCKINIGYWHEIVNKEKIKQ
jgi:hypothetical protein